MKTGFTTMKAKSSRNKCFQHLIQSRIRDGSRLASLREINKGTNPKLSAALSKFSRGGSQERGRQCRPTTDPIAHSLSMYSLINPGVHSLASSRAAGFRSFSSFLCAQLPHKDSGRPTHKSRITTARAQYMRH